MSTDPPPSNPPPPSPKSLAANFPLRYAPLLLGLLIALGAAGMQTWKRSALEEARGNVMSLQFKLAKLREKRADSEDDKRQDRYDKQIEEMTEDDIPDAEKNVASEQVDAANGVWFLDMSQWLGISLVGLGFIYIAATGSSHEQIGSLIGLAFLLSQLR